MALPLKYAFEFREFRYRRAIQLKCRRGHDGDRGLNFILAAWDEKPFARLLAPLLLSDGEPDLSGRLAAHLAAACWGEVPRYLHPDCHFDGRDSSAFVEPATMLRHYKHISARDASAREVL